MLILTETTMAVFVGIIDEHKNNVSTPYFQAIWVGNVRCGYFFCRNFNQ